MAAAYLFHIVQNHPFIDGNKWGGAAAAYVFLALNDMRLTADVDAYAELVLSVAHGELIDYCRGRFRGVVDLARLMAFIALK